MKKNDSAVTAEAQKAVQEKDWKCILRLEDSILKTWSLTRMVIEILTRQLDERGHYMESVAAGIQLLESSAFNDMDEAFTEVTAYCNHLRNQLENTPKRK